jgi:SAM-dependent methyltransferase
MHDPRTSWHEPAAERTISDFGEQWRRFRSNDGYYGSESLFTDICAPLISPEAFRGASVADLGSGTGRIVEMLLQAGAARVTAVEPSAAYDVLVENLDHAGGRVHPVNTTADRLPGGPYDFVVALGVLHHIPQPSSAVKRAFERLKPNGQIVIWVYGREGNGLYLAFAGPLRMLTTRLPDRALAPICAVLTAALTAYVWACRFLPLPMRAYMRAVIARYGWHYRYLTVFDQLNPRFSKYYRKAEVEALIRDAGFVDVRLLHRHGYSWTAVGRKPA